MTEASNWRDVKARARAADPIWDGAGRVARRQQMREQMLAAVSRAERLRDLQRQIVAGSGSGMSPPKAGRA